MAVQESHEMNGRFPDLDVDFGDIDDLPPRASPLQLAQFYGTLVAMWRQLWPRVTDALRWLHHAVLGLNQTVDEHRDQIITEIRELRSSLVAGGQMRKRLPSLQDLEPEITANGHVRLAPHAFEAIQERIAFLENQAKRSDEEAKLDKARAEGANAAVAALTAQAKKRSERFYQLAPIVLTILGMLGGLGGWLLHRWTQEPPAPIPVMVPTPIVQPH